MMPTQPSSFLSERPLISVFWAPPLQFLLLKRCYRQVPMVKLAIKFSPSSTLQFKWFRFN